MGTHPIFESDFDCLTVWMSQLEWLRRVRDRQSLSLVFSTRKQLVRKHQWGRAFRIWSCIHCRLDSSLVSPRRHPMRCDLCGSISKNGRVKVGRQSASFFSLCSKKRIVCFENVLTCRSSHWVDMLCVCVCVCLWAGKEREEAASILWQMDEDSHTPVRLSLSHFNNSRIRRRNQNIIFHPFSTLRERKTPQHQHDHALWDSAVSKPNIVEAQTLKHTHRSRTRMRTQNKRKI